MILDLDGVSVRRGDRTTVDEVSLQVADGEVVAILGPNGAGKSTLLGAVGGLVPHTGRVTTEGRVVTVLQSPGLAKRSVHTNVDLAQAWFGVPRAQRRANTTRALAALRADHLAQRHAATLSGGEARRVHLARGIAVEPDLLLLDEPFAGLDAETRTHLVDDTASVLRETARATVVVLHERSDAWALADRIVVMLEGRIVADAAPDELLRHPPTAEVARFLGYDGQLLVDGSMALTRAPHVRVVAEGGQPATVLRRTRREDGVLLELELPGGRVRCLHPDPTVADQVRVAIDHLATFPAES